MTEHDEVYTGFVYDSYEDYEESMADNSED